MLKKCVLTFVLLLLGVSLVSASDAALSMLTFKRLAAIETLLQKDKFSQAQTQLDKLKLKIPKLSPADKAYTYHMQALLYLYQQQYSQARKYYLSSYQQPGLGDTTKLQVVEMLANLSMHDEDYKQAIVFAKKYLQMIATSEKSKSSKTGLLILASAHYQLEEYKLAVAPLKQVIASYVPDKSAYSTLFAVYYQLQRLPEATKIVEKMIRIWPNNAEYWLQLASIYLEQNQYSKSLEIMQLSLAQGFLVQENELTQYVYALYEKNLPHKAATILSTALEQSMIKKNIQNYNLLATLYSTAKENKKALVVYKKASKLSATGKEDLYIAQIYFDQENYQQTIKHAKLALNKGIKKPGNAHMLIAVAYSELANVKATKTHLNKAVMFEETKLTAQQWLNTLGGG